MDFAHYTASHAVVAAQYAKSARPERGASISEMEQQKINNRVVAKRSPLRQMCSAAVAITEQPDAGSDVGAMAHDRYQETVDHYVRPLGVEKTWKLDIDAGR
jgi:hypothetical protein